MDQRLGGVESAGFERGSLIELRLKLRIRLSPIDELHCVAHVAWTAAYARKDQSDVAIDFDVHYLVQMLDVEPKVFGWVSGDEQAPLNKHGIV